MSTNAAEPQDPHPGAQHVSSGGTRDTAIVTADRHRAEMLRQAEQVRARFRTILDTSRAVLGEQPSANLVYASARRITTAINQLAEEIAGERD